MGIKQILHRSFSANSIDGAPNRNSINIGPQVRKNFLQLVSSVLLDREEPASLSLICLISGGHLLLEDVPGTGKTSLAKSLASMFAMEMRRIQCTNDLLPSDILGYNSFDKETNKLRFVDGPIFSNFVLADELNRCSARTQSAFLQAMEENSVTLDGLTRRLPDPFFLIATQNHNESTGVSKLPESQLDRFGMSISLQLARGETQRKILNRANSMPKIGENVKSAQLSSMYEETELKGWMEEVRSIFCSESVVDYMVRISDFLSQKGGMISPRSTLFWLRSAKVTAWLDGYSCVIPEHVSFLVPPVFGHRFLGVGKEDVTRIFEECFSSIQAPVHG